MKKKEWNDYRKIARKIQILMCVKKNKSLNTKKSKYLKLAIVFIFRNLLFQERIIMIVNFTQPVLTEAKDSDEVLLTS